MAASDDAAPPAAVPAQAADGAVLLALLLRGALSADEIASASAVPPAELGRAVEGLLAEGLLRRNAARPAGDVLELTPSGRVRAAAALAEEAALLRPLLEPRYAEFALINRRVKETLHRWQVRRRDGFEALNDHRDPSYDARVLAELRAAQAAVAAWLAPLAAARARYARLRDRLAVALRRAAAGDTAAVAGVTRDSFHLAWWQLHADLLRMLGRERGPDDA